MKIRHIINNLGPGGAERLVVELSRGMRERGHDVAIIQLTPSPVDSPPAIAAKDYGLNVTSIGSSRFDMRVFWRLWRLTRGADVVHAHLFPAFYWVALLSRRRKVLTEHNTDNRRRRGGLVSRIDRTIYRRFDCCVAISDGVNESLRAYLGRPGRAVRCDTIENGIRLGDYVTEGPVGRGGPLRLIAIGTLNARKNFSEAIAAVSGVSDVSLTIVGDGPLRGDLESQVERNGQGQQVTFLGSRSDVPELLSRHHVLVLTSEWEGFGLVAVEAMAAHVPVLAPNVPGLGQIVGHGDSGLLHRPHDIDRLRAHVERLRDDEQYRKRLAIGAHQRSLAYSIETCIDNYLALYGNLISHEHPPE